MTDTNFDPAAGVTVEVTLEALPESEEDDASGGPPALPMRLVTAETDADGVVGADGFLTAPVGAWLKARIVSAPFKYQEIEDLPRTYRGHEERWTIREDITLAAETLVETGEIDAETGAAVTRTELVRPTAEELLAKAAEIAPTLMCPRKPWASVRALDAATGETVVGVPCSVTVPSHLAGVMIPTTTTTTSGGGDDGGGAGGGPKEVVLFSGLTGDDGSMDIIYPPPKEPGMTLAMSATPAEKGRFLVGAAAAASSASLPLRVVRDAPARAPDEPVSVLALTMALRRSVETDDDVAFWLQRDAFLPSFYTPTGAGAAGGGDHEGRVRSAGGVVAARAQLHHLARLTPNARRGEVLSAPPAPLRALAAATLAAALAAADDGGDDDDNDDKEPSSPPPLPSSSDAAAAVADQMNQCVAAAAEAIRRGLGWYAGAVPTASQPPPPSDMSKSKTVLRAPLQTLTLEQKLKRWGAPYAGSSRAVRLLFHTPFTPPRCTRLQRAFTRLSTLVHNQSKTRRKTRMYTSSV